MLCRVPSFFSGCIRRFDICRIYLFARQWIVAVSPSVYYDPWPRQFKRNCEIYRFNNLTGVTLPTGFAILILIIFRMELVRLQPL